jgi:hypothetical protein
MPLPRIWKAMRWFAAHPPADVLVRAYFQIKDPPPRRPVAARALTSEEEVVALGRALGMRG